MPPMQELVGRQRMFFDTNATKNISFRIEQLKKLEHLLRSNEALLQDAIYKDFKKSFFDTYTTELALVYKEIRTVIKNLRKWAAPKRAKTNLLNFPGRSYVLPEPLGVSLIIGAWNYPYLLAFSPAIASLGAGNTVILKPSELPLHTSQVMAKLVNENFPKEYFTVVEGGVNITTQLLEERFDKIFFTGSPTIGRIVYLAAAKNLTPVTLELGGKSPAFVSEDCDLAIAVKRLVWAKFLNAGQTCIAPDYILVHQSVYERFLELAKQEIENSKFSVDNENYVQIINEKNLERLKSILDRNKIFIGGAVDEASRYFEPTVLRDVFFDDRIMQEEIFGPILPVIAYSDLDAAIAAVKRMTKPLSCYIFTKSNSYRDKILQEVSFGGGAVNEAAFHFSNNNLPFGGVGDSGMGSYHGEAGFKAFSHFKSVLEKPTRPEVSLRYYPHTKRKLSIIRLLLGEWK